MLLLFKDLDLNPVANYTMQMHVADVALVELLVPCDIGHTLRASSVANLTVEGRKTGDSTWVDLETTGILVTPYAPGDVQFDFRITAASTLGRRSFNLTV